MADFASKSLLLATGVAGDTCVVSNVVLRINGASVKYFESIPTAVLLGSIGAPELASSGVTLGVYGDSTNIPQITVDADGRITAASNIAVSIPLGGVSADAGQQLTLGTDSKPLATGLATAAALAAEVTARTDNDITAAAVAAGTLTLTRASGNLTAALPVSVNHSIVGNSSSTPLSLVSDQATPAGSLAYGTSAAGAKGWVDVNALLDPTNNGVPTTGTYVLGYINGVGPQLVPVV